MVADIFRKCLKTKLRKLPPGEGVGNQVTSKSTTCSLQMELMSALGQITKKAEKIRVNL